jgi:hypothetical protein
MLFACTAGLFLAAGCSRPAATAPVAITSFLGNAACAECHSSEFQKHRDSRHATTMRSVDKASLGAAMPVPGDIPDTNFVLKESGSRVMLAVKYQPELEQQLQFARGSGKFALTFSNIHEKLSIVELRESYYPTLNRWHYTPGQAHIEGDGLGRMYTGAQARACISCHTSALDANSLTPDPRHFGVGCESCHGPGKEHVAAIRAGKTSDIHMERLGKLDAATMNERCGRCHRSAKSVPPGDKSTQRFQPYGLMKSRCYLESGAKLSCQTCHDPHMNASTDPKPYEKICLSCHVSTKSNTQVSGPAPGKACPVNSKSGCIPCHMPQREVTRDAPISMADHFIRVHRPDEEDINPATDFNEIN